MAGEKKNINNNVEGKEMSFEERQYQRLIDARNFHYENFNKWSLYFYAIIAALFMGYYQIENNFVLSCILALVGYIVSICCYLSGKGYYYWEISWIKLVQAYERRLIVEEGKKSYYLYSIFVNKEGSSYPTKLLDGSNISSSKLSLLMSFVISAAWGYLLASTVSHGLWACTRDIFESVGGINPYLKIALEICICCIMVYITYRVVQCAAKNKMIHSYMSNLDEATAIQELNKFIK